MAPGVHRAPLAPAPPRTGAPHPFGCSGCSGAELKLRSQVGHAPVALRPVAVTAQELEILEVIRAALCLGNDVIDFEVLGLEVFSAARAGPALLSVQGHLVDLRVRKLAEVRRGTSDRATIWPKKPWSPGGNPTDRRPGPCGRLAKARGTGCGKVPSRAGAVLFVLSGLVAASDLSAQRSRADGTRCRALERSGRCRSLGSNPGRTRSR